MSEKTLSWSRAMLNEEQKARSTPPVPRTAPVLESAALPDVAAVPAHPQPLYAAPAPPRNSSVSEAAPVPGTPAQTAIDPGKWTGVPNDLEDKIYPTLDPFQARLLGRLYRLSWGFHTDICKVSVPTLAKACSMGESKARRSIDVLEARGFIKQLDVDLSNRDQKSRGVIIKMLLPKAAVRQNAPVRDTGGVQKSAPVRRTDIKDKAFKEKDIKEEIEITQEMKDTYRAIHGREWEGK